jgi:hypothetical protein
MDQVHVHVIIRTHCIQRPAMECQPRLHSYRTVHTAWIMDIEGVSYGSILCYLIHTNYINETGVSYRQYTVWDKTSSSNVKCVLKCP